MNLMNEVFETVCSDSSQYYSMIIERKDIAKQMRSFGFKPYQADLRDSFFGVLIFDKKKDAYHSLTVFMKAERDLRTDVPLFYSDETPNIRHTYKIKNYNLSGMSTDASLMRTLKALKKLKPFMTKVYLYISRDRKILSSGNKVDNLGLILPGNIQKLYFRKYLYSTFIDSKN